ncbi:MAG TPA: hypothetical protein VJW55_05315, partial [Candidatus Angelobacter sp.]|nr:hypothetical protein [Candidatus Angelobacter sp.]
MKSKTKSKKKTKKYKSKPWHTVVDHVMGSVFRIIAGESAGTCFLVSIGTAPDKSKTSALFATAWHVLDGLQNSSADIEIISADKSKMFSSKTHRMGFFRVGITFDAVLIMVEVGC